jgi:hypothetical protein
MKPTENKIAFTKLLNEVLIEEFPEIKFIKVSEEELWTGNVVYTVYVVGTKFPDSSENIKNKIYQLAKYMSIKIYNIVFGSESS